MGVSSDWDRALFNAVIPETGSVFGWLSSIFPSDSAPSPDDAVMSFVCSLAESVRLNPSMDVASITILPPRLLAALARMSLLSLGGGDEMLGFNFDISAALVAITGSGDVALSFQKDRLAG